MANDFKKLKEKKITKFVLHNERKEKRQIMCNCVLLIFFFLKIVI